MTKLVHSYSSLTLFNNCPKRYYEQRIAKSVIDPGGEAAHYGTFVHEALEHRLRSGTPLPQQLAHYEAYCQQILEQAARGELGVEAEMTVTKDLQPTGWWSDDAWLRSKLDVFIKFNTYVVVLDFKTGKKRRDSDQLEMFAGQIFAHYPEVTRVKTAFLWLQDRSADTADYTRDDNSRIWRNIIVKTRHVEHALATNRWLTKPGPLCRFCPCRSICPDAAL